MRKTLLPCPFCGSQDIEEQNIRLADRLVGIAAVCSVCHARGPDVPKTRHPETPQDLLEEHRAVAKRWNARQKQRESA